MPVRQRQGAELSDAGSRARLPDEAVHRRGRAPLAGDGRGPSARPRAAAGEAPGQSDAVPVRRAAGSAGARIYSIAAVATDPPRALDFGSPAFRGLERHHTSTGLTLAPRLGRERRAGVEQRLAPFLDLGAPLHVLEGQERGDARVGERALHESSGARPALRVGLEPGIGAIAEEARDGDVGKADLAEDEALGRQLALQVVERRGNVLVERLSDPLLVAGLLPDDRPHDLLVEQ